MIVEFMDLCFYSYVIELFDSISQYSNWLRAGGQRAEGSKFESRIHRAIPYLWAMDNVQKHNICINIPSSQTFTVQKVKQCYAWWAVGLLLETQVSIVFWCTP
jgi:hypothetical protein